uniref:Haloacid dehalogenase-like hydrolase domain-containing protein 3 n=1 Tax=Oryza glumipatula TaxID=40148 RepID=A0A0E0ARC2_9ORYZ
MPAAAAAAARGPLLHLQRNPAPRLAAARRSFSSSGMRCVSAGAGAGGGGRERRSSPAFGGLLLDAGGTLLQLARPVAQTYASLGRRYGMSKSEESIKEGFKRAFSAPWPKTLRYQGDGRPFWRIVVAEATECTNNDYFEEVYEYYAHGDAWRLPAGAYETLRDLKDAGVKLAVVSNFDTRLRKLLKDLHVSDMFDAIVVSSEVGHEKPAPEIFKRALDQIGVEASKAVHVGDDETADKAGANAIGLECWLWGQDVRTFSEIRDRILTRFPQ